ncbi:hypothetical protein H9651_12900 [Microbacterium sp. Sa4CUA7]|uniref:Uncharacterized protein n=1 Tax=Microbacterium pullorum TaxID=2762236 RepID=A0ABR8S4Z2_9MICO|nr:hypothetical protein [Microbacterium pullorum]MBD7958541.1 hypothetical protein [Microbacterium pullorum]
MGNRSHAHERAEEGRPRAAGMRWTLAGVALVVMIGVGTFAWLGMTAPGERQEAARPTEGSSPVSATPGPTIGAAPAAGSEVPPLTTSDTPANRLPALPAPRALVSTPLPADGFASGTLVAGFPVEVAGPVPGDDVIDTSIAVDDTTAQVTLTARTDATAESVRTHYQQAWAALSLTPGVTSGAELTYSDSFSSVSLAFGQNSGTGTVYTVYAVLRAE